MAVDSRDKRASALLGRAFPNPGGGLASPEARRHTAGLYRMGGDSPPPSLPAGTQWAARTEAVGWARTRSEGR